MLMRRNVVFISSWASTDMDANKSFSGMMNISWSALFCLARRPLLYFMPSCATMLVPRSGRWHLTPLRALIEQGGARCASMRSGWYENQRDCGGAGGLPTDFCPSVHGGHYVGGDRAVRRCSGIEHATMGERLESRRGGRVGRVGRQAASGPAGPTVPGPTGAVVRLVGGGRLRGRIRQRAASVAPPNLDSQVPRRGLSSPSSRRSSTAPAWPLVALQ